MDLLIPATQYRKILLGTLDCILERFQTRDTGGFIDTKIDIRTGRDLSHTVGEVDLFGSETVYGWIQGRGLEALCGHHAWIQNDNRLPDSQKARYLDRLEEIIRCVSTSLDSARRESGGRLSFWMDRDGSPFVLDACGCKQRLDLQADQSSFGDIFGAKGLLAAAVFLKDEKMIACQSEYLKEVLHNIQQGRFRSDQQSFDPNNPVAPVEGRLSHGSWMISIGACALGLGLLDDQKWMRLGFEFLNNILEHHVNLDQRFPELQEYDFFEFRGATGEPYLQDNDILCDPGHGLEFVGLSMKFLSLVRCRTDLDQWQADLIARADAVLPVLLKQTFALGYNDSVGGIYKLVSLRSRQPVHTDMPWWNLPETMRAAALTYEALPDPDIRRTCEEILHTVSRAFLKNYINPSVYHMAYQTLNRHGEPVPVVPATPDADPGYHTGLSIIDVLYCLDRLRRES